MDKYQGELVIRLDALVVCWGVYGEFANISTAVNWIIFIFLLPYKDNRHTENFQLAEIYIFGVQYWKTWLSSVELP